MKIVLTIFGYSEIQWNRFNRNKNKREIGGKMEDYLYAINNILKRQIQMDVSVFDKAFFVKALEKRMLKLSIETYEQ